MLSRYSTPIMQSLWSDEVRFQVWAEVEIAAAKAQGAPIDALTMMHRAAVPTPGEVAAAEQQTRHDVMAFLQVWRYNITAVETDVMPGDPGSTHGAAVRWTHKGMTSSDLVDSATAVITGDAVEELVEAGEQLAGTLAQHALSHFETTRVGRTHGQHAEATTWGHLMAYHADMVARAVKRLATAGDGLAVKLSGPVGDYKWTTRDEELEFAGILGQKAAAVSTQVVSRDRLVDVVYACAAMAGAVESLAMQVRLGQQTERGEVAEGFGAWQKGSSAMPHKRNPITAEQLCGLARIVRAQVAPMLESVALWDERDISHSSVERVALCDATTVCHYMMVTARAMVEGLVINDEAMAYQVAVNREVLRSAAAKNALVESGTGPEEAWLIVQRAVENGELGKLVGELGVDQSTGDRPGEAGADHRTAHVRRLLERLVNRGH